MENLTLDSDRRKLEKRLLVYRSSRR